MSSTLSLMKQALQCKCPKCRKGNLFQGGFLSNTLRKQCDECGFDYTKNDIADGPVVLLVSVLGIVLVPLAFVFENIFAPSLWVHVVLWTAVALFFTIGGLRPIKSFIISMQYKQSPADWD